MARLVLMRHGDAAQPGGAGDVDRPLTERGRREAAAAGAWIDAHVGTVDQVLCSIARRTRETVEATGVRAPVEYVESIYQGWTGDLLDAVRAVEGAETVLFVGHALGTPDLAALLAGDGSDPQAVRGVDSGFPTAAVAVVEHDGAWSTLEPYHARLVAYAVPR